MTGRRQSRSLFAVALGLLVFPAPPGAAQVVLLEPEPTGRMVSVAIAFPAGHRLDPSGAEGTAFLLGQVLEAEGNHRLFEQNARIEIQVEADRFLLTLLAPPARWEISLRELQLLLAAATLPGSRVAEMRARLDGRHLFEAGAPVRAFQREKSVLLFGEGDPASRPAGGTRATIASLDGGTLAAFLQSELRLPSATISVTGPVTVQEVERALGVRALIVQRGRASERPPEPTHPAPDSLPPAPELRVWGASVPALRVPAVPLRPAAWSDPHRSVIDEDLTSTWIGIAFPIPPGTPHTLAEFVAHLVTEALNPVPPEPGAYAAAARVESVRGAPVLVVTATVDPRVTTLWEDRILATIQQLAVAPPEGAFFELTRRRFRTARLLALTTPESRARWLVERAETDGTVPDLEEDAWRVDQQGVRDLAAALGPPRVLLYGPVSMMGR